ncbi:MAG: DUF262 domain-containing protein, partial [Chloroflexota bacterium]
MALLQSLYSCAELRGGMVKASETYVLPLLDGARQYVVPLFQRTYSWGRPEWATLLSDIESLIDSPSAPSHFLGSIVTMPAPSGPEFPTVFLIDGQQRLTTLLILLAALRDGVKDSDAELGEKIDNRYLTNPFEKDRARYKLIPTRVDQKAFFDVMEGSPASSHTISEAYKFFLAQIRKKPSAELAQLALAIVSQLVLVSISLANDDNPYLIFESLNAKGRELTQSDLIRNYFLMGGSPEAQEILYNTKWKPLDDYLPD